MAASVLVLAVACNPLGGSKAPTTPSSSPESTPISQPSGGLDAQVPMPAGFPSDVPVYPGARLTAGASFAGSGMTTWGMEWETLDGVDKVHSFFASKFSQGDWTLNFTSDTSTAFAATFARKSNSQAKGVVGADGSSGVTRISLYLAQPSS